MSHENFVIVKDTFSKQAESLQKYFQQCFANPLEATENRFQWDYWHVPEQYTLVRTLASTFFPEELFDSWKSEVEQWGLNHLGCGEISPAWVSYYVEGCEQLFHADNPHGPWAFVFSLTDWVNRKFLGGETKLLAEKVLNYWDDFQSDLGFEENSLIQRIAPEFNRLTVFDPRVPHGVETVRGVRDPRFSRIVIHGWFLEPTPVITGGLEETDLQECLADSLNPALDDIESKGSYNGYVCLKLKISSTGQVKQIQLLQNTLRSVELGERSPKDIPILLESHLASACFPACRFDSELILPLVFR